MLVAALCVAYVIGCFSPGWWLVRRATGRDLRETGSGGTGATNAARVLGGWGFGVILLLDAGKAAAAVFLARWMVPETTWSVLALPVVVAGHIWPAQLRFQGGRGAAPLLGGAIALNPWFLPAAAAGAGIAALIKRRSFVITSGAALAGVVASGWLLPETASRTAFAIAVVLVVLAHRSHFVRVFSRSRSQTSPAAHGNRDSLQDRHHGG